MAQSLPAMKTNPKFIFFTDFDGTITLFDSNDFMVIESAESEHLFDVCVFLDATNLTNLLD